MGELLGIEIVTAYGETTSLVLPQANKHYFVSAVCLSNFNLSGFYHIMHNGRDNMVKHVEKDAPNFTFELDTVKYNGGNGPYLITAVCFGVK